MNLVEAKKVLDDLEIVIRDNHLNTYDVAIMCGEGITDRYYTQCNLANNSYSITKLYTNTAIGILYDQNKIKLTDRIVDILKDDTSFKIDKKWKDVTVAHCLAHNMGVDKGVIDVDVHNVNEYGTNDYLKRAFDYPPIYKPGEYRFYTDVAHYFLSRCITSVTGTKADDFLRENLINPMKCEAVAWYRCPMGYTIGATGIFIKSCDMVKLAWLYLNKGKWFDKQIISEKWVNILEKEEYDIYQYGKNFFGKGGMLGQMTMYNKEKEYAVAWHSCGKDNDEDQAIIKFFDERV